MILMTRYNNDAFYTNPDLILTLEATPDTLVTMTSGEKFMVKESIPELTNRIIAYKRQIFLGPTAPETKSKAAAKPKSTTASKPAAKPKAAASKPKK